MAKPKTDQRINTTVSGRTAPKVYTRHGDGGMTDVPALGRAGKDSPRVAACGALDEFNCTIGELRARIGQSRLPAPTGRRLDRRLQGLQRDLLSMGAKVSGAVAVNRGPGAALRKAIKRFEAEIDEMQKDLPPLTGFILPGGEPLSAAAHLCRAFCRRAERSAVAAIGDAPEGPVVVPWLNRLSDWFFVLARWLASETGHLDEPWRTSPESRRRGKGK